MTIRELWKITKEQNKPLLGTLDVSKYPFMTEYNAEFTDIDRNFAKTKGFFSTLWKEDDAAEELEEFQLDVKSLLSRKKVNYQRLYDLTKVQYNPIDNYKMSETMTDTNTRTNKETHTFGDVKTVNNSTEDVTTDATLNETLTKLHGATSQTNIYGQDTNSIEYGATTSSVDYGTESTTFSIGAVNNNDIIGERNDVTKTGVAGYNSSSFANADETNVSNGIQNNSHTETARTDSNTKNARTDSTEISNHTDTTTRESRTDNVNTTTFTDTDTTDSTGKNISKGTTSGDGTVTHLSPDTFETSTSDSVVHTGERSGNIGVTTSQQMALNEVSLWDSFEFYMIIFDDIVEELCSFHDNGYEPFAFDNNANVINQYFNPKPTPVPPVGSKVKVNQILTSGIPIASIEVDDVSTTIFAPESSAGLEVTFRGRPRSSELFSCNFDIVILNNKYAYLENNTQFSWNELVVKHPNSAVEFNMSVEVIEGSLDGRRISFPIYGKQSDTESFIAGSIRLSAIKASFSISYLQTGQDIGSTPIISMLTPATFS